MSELYKRLRAVGFDTPYIRSIALPSWWDDAAAESPSGFQEGMMLIARHLGVSLESLGDPGSPIELRDFGPCNFKKMQGVADDELAIARALCTRAAQIAAASVNDPADSTTVPTGQQIREAILQSGAPWVSLSALLDWCWSNGIPVLHVSHFPRQAKKMDGMAALVGGRPVIVLSKNAKREAWLLFILAHELGHIVSGHVSDNGVLVDEKVTKQSEDAQEQEANATALAILTGDADCRFTSPGRWPNAQELASMAVDYGKNHQVDPGHVVLNYSNNIGPTFHALGNAALKLISPQADAPRVIREAMASRLDWSAIPEDSSEFLMRITAPHQKK